MRHQLSVYLTRLLAVLSALLAAGLAAAPAAAGPLFPNPVFEVGSNPGVQAVADFDGDGIADLAVADYGYTATDPGYVSILMGRGDGTFHDQRLIGPMGQVEWVAAGCLDADGTPDLVVRIAERYPAPSFAAVLFGNGDGTFAPAQTIPFDIDLFTLELGDVNGDGRTDLIGYGATYLPTPLLQVEIGDGNGGFTKTASYQPPIPLQPSLRIVDADEAGRDDIIAPTASASGQIEPNEVITLRSLGDGTFDPIASFATGHDTLYLFSADLDGDGHADLATTSIDNADYSATFAVHLGLGDGHFVAAPASGVDHPVAVAAPGDYNRDGHTDLAAKIEGEGVMVLLGRGDGTFDQMTPFLGGTGSTAVVTADFDRDGIADLSVTSNWGEAVDTFRGNGDGTFGPAPVAARLDTFLNGAVCADFDADGNLDLAAGIAGSTEVAVLMGRGDGRFDPDARYPAGINPSAMATADFDNDGHPDLAITSENWIDTLPTPIPAGSLSILLGAGDGTFAPGPIYATDPMPSVVVSADFDGDGAQDLIMVNECDAACLTPSAGVAFFRGLGDGTFAAPAAVNGGAWPVAVAVGDFNGDQHPDLAIGTRGSPYDGVPGNLSVALGNGNGTFQAPQIVFLTEDTRGVAVGDLDGDGDADVALADVGDYLPDRRGGLYALLGRGDGTFQAPTGIERAGVGPLDVRIGDFNADGIPDLAAANNSGDESFHLGIGDGTFQHARRFGFFGGAQFVCNRDFNSDARADLLVGTWSGVLLFDGRTPAGPIVIQAVLSLTAGMGRKAKVSWGTTGEDDLRGFNVLSVNAAGQTTTLNAALIPCHECTTGSGGRYNWSLSKSTIGKDLYIEVVHLDGRTERVGPLPRRLGGATPTPGKFTPQVQSAADRRTAPGAGQW